MKKLLIIAGGFAFVCFASVFILCWWAIDALTLERGRNKTAEARDKRWPKNGKAEEPIQEVKNPEISQPLKVQSDENAQ